MKSSESLGDSGLYHYVELDFAQVSSWIGNIQYKNSDGREYLLIPLSINNGSEEFLYDPELVCVDKHISIDRFVSNDKVIALDYYFTHAHVTYVYQKSQHDDSTKITVHAYYNRHGAIVNCHASKTRKVDGQKQAAENMMLTSDLNNFIYNNAKNDASELIEKLINNKQECFKQLTQQFQDKESELCFNQKNIFTSPNDIAEERKAIVSQLNDLLCLLDNINKLDEFSEDNIRVFLVGQLNFFSSQRFDLFIAENSVTSTGEQNSCIGAQDKKNAHKQETKKINKHKNSKAKKNKKKAHSGSEKVSGRTDHIFDFEAYIAENTMKVTHDSLEVQPLENISPVCDSAQSLITYLMELPPGLSFLTCECWVRAAIRRRHTELLAYFKEKLSQADVDAVIKLYPFLSSVRLNSLFDVCLYFITNCVMLCPAHDLIRSSHLSDIGDYLYLNCPAYRSEMILLNKVRYRLASTHGGPASRYEEKSFLFEMFLQGKFLAFKMLINHGARLNGASASNLYEGRPIPLAHSIIIDYALNQDIRFLTFLKSKGGLLTKPLSPLSDFRFIDKKDSNKKIFIERFCNLNNLLAVAMKRHASLNHQYPLLVMQLLAKDTDVRTIIYHLANMINQKNHRFSFMPIAGDEFGIKIFNDRHHAQSWINSKANIFANDELVKSKIVSFYFPDNGIRDEVVHFFITEIVKHFPNLSRPEQDEVIISLYDRAKSHDFDKPIEAQMLVMIAQLLDSLAANLDANQYAMRIKLMVFRVELLLIQRDFLGAKGLFGHLEQALDGVPAVYREHPSIEQAFLVFHQVSVELRAAVSAAVLPVGDLTLYNTRGVSTCSDPSAQSVSRIKL